MLVRKIIEAICLHCGYVGRYEKEEDVPKVCPACQDGKSTGWSGITYRDESGRT